MPTFRNSSWTKKPFNCFSAEYSFDKEKFASVLSDNNLVFVYKPHFYDLEFIKNINISDRFVLIDDDSYDELYNFIGLCDVLITDYSSIYFDFIITKKESSDSFILSLVKSKCLPVISFFLLFYIF